MLISCRYKMLKADCFYTLVSSLRTVVCKYKMLKADSFYTLVSSLRNVVCFCLGATFFFLLTIPLSSSCETFSDLKNETD